MPWCVDIYALIRSSMVNITPCMLLLLSSAVFIQKDVFSVKSVKLFGSRSGPTLCQS